ncbi:RagB/SusD family nutrient uptake outer membrane protein [Longitalea arenae]|uniref:RagB/SusD family nutrient uptake outer membrane protein n=1 Tax=Longitalea arenae TaxID=2812558 RepID=UPI0019686027|nr:RagB/SusD family nutrient uptake outer membrane protein [Longitalea arenae]
MLKNQLLALSTLFMLVAACSKKDKNGDDAPPAHANVKAVQDYLLQTDSVKAFGQAFQAVTFADADVSSGITVFAPVNSAVVSYDRNARVTEAMVLTSDEVKDHIVKGIVNKPDLSHGKRLTALSGKELVVTIDGDKIMINGVAILSISTDASKPAIYTVANVLSKKVAAEDSFTSKAEAQAFLDTAYTYIGKWHHQQITTDAVLSDDAVCGNLTALCDLDNFNITGVNGHLISFWYPAYTYITRLNRLILHVPALNLPLAESNNLIAQAKGLRGFLYLQLATYYGELPLQTSLTNENLSRSSLTETYTFIKNDLTEAMGLLPARFTGADHRRISADACKLLLARVAMAQGDYIKAKQLTSELIQSNTYSLVAANTIFVSDENAETIWNIHPGINANYASVINEGGTKSFIPALRYAEVLLINSEARVNLGELDANGINQLLARRNQPTVTFTDQNQARELVQSTWKTELYREGQRFAKLVKWGRAMEVLAAKGFKEHNKLMPIPQPLLDTNPNVYQNPGY